MRGYLIVLCLLLAACGQPVEIHYIYNVPMQELERMTGYPVKGYAWRGQTFELGDLLTGQLKGHWECNIWLAARENFSSEDCWNKVIQHEQRHCYEGDFHPDTPEGSFVACARRVL